MIRAKFSIQLPTSLWITELSMEAPESRFRLLSGFLTDDRAVELGEIVGDGATDAGEAMRTHPSIHRFELLESTDRRVLAKYETTDTLLYEFVADLSLPVEFPLQVQNGRYQFDLTGTQADLDQFQTALDDGGFHYELLSLMHTTEASSLLTDRQRELLETAVRLGYFEVPRESTLAEVAENLDIDKSTASTVLRRGESTLVKWFLSGSGGAVSDSMA